MSKLILDKDLSRRSVLKGMGAFAAGAALAGCSKDDNNNYYVSDGDPGEAVKVVEKTYHAACRSNCQSNCGIMVHTRNGRVVRTSKSQYVPEGGLELNANNQWVQLPNDLIEEAYRPYERICLRGLSHVQRFYSRTRLQRPLKQMGERGDLSTFQEISWDEAIDEIVENIVKNYRTDDDIIKGKNILTWIGSGNYGAIQGLSGAPDLLGAILNTSKVWAAYDMALPVGLSKCMGWGTFPFLTGNELRDIKNADNLILWGSNMAEAHMMGWGFVRDGRQESGGNIKNVVSIDVMATSTAVKSDYFYKIRPGSDTALAMSMINYVIANGLYDEAFMLHNADAYFLIKENADGTHSYLRERDLVAGGGRKLALWSKAEGKVVFTYNADKGLIYGGNSRTEIYKVDPIPADPNDPDDAGTPGVPADPADYDLFYEDPAYTLLDGTVTSIKTSFKHLQEKTAAFTLDEGESYTGISGENIKALAELYCSGKTTIYLSFGTSHHYNSHRFGHAIAALGTITGNIGKEGASIGNFFCSFPTAPGGSFIPARDGRPSSVMVADLAEKKRNGQSDINMLMITCANPMSNNVNSKQDFIQTLFNKQYVDFIVTSDIEMTETARYSDIVLPACHWFEAEDLLNGSKHSFSTYQEKIAEPMYESKSDMDIVRLIVTKLKGKLTAAVDVTIDSTFFVGNRYKTDWEFLVQRVTSANSRITPENLKAMKFVKIPDPTHTHISLEHVTVDADKNVRSVNPDRPQLLTSGITGRLELFCEYPLVFIEAIVTYSDKYWNGAGGVPLTGLHGQLNEAGIELTKSEQFVAWEEPSDSWSGPTNNPDLEAERQKFPLIYMQEHTRWRVHTQWTEVPWLRELDPEPILKISPQDASTYNISTGDMVKISNDRGHATLRAIVTAALPQGLINVPKGWQRWFFTGETYSDIPNLVGSYNDLTNPKFHPLSTDQAFFDARVKIERV